MHPGSGAEKGSLSGAQDHCLSADTVGAVCLPAEERDFPRGSECWVSGWGHTDPGHSESAPRALGAQDGGSGVGGEESVPRSEAPQPPPPWPQGSISPLLLWHHPRLDGGPRVLLGEQTGIFPETQALSSPSPPPRSARASASGCMCDAYPSPPSLMDPPGQSPGLPCPWGRPSSTSASPASVCDPPIYLPAARSSDVLQDSVVPLLSTQLCNSSCVYSGALTPRMLCAGYLDGRADACQVRPRAWCGAGAAGWAPG